MSLLPANAMHSCSHLPNRLLVFKSLKNLYCLLYLNEHLDFSSFPSLPQISRDVEEDGLEEEGEADPLVVFVIADLEFNCQNYNVLIVN